MSCHAIYYNGFSTLWRSAYRRDEFKAKSDIATTGWKLEEDFGLLNMIIKPTLHSIHKFDHQRFHTPTATSFSLQIILSSSVARLTNLEKKISLWIKKHFIPRFFTQEFNWKVKCLRLNLKSNATITSNQIMNLDVQLSACTSWTSELSDIPLSITCSRQYQINSEKNHSYSFTKSTVQCFGWGCLKHNERESCAWATN